MNMKLFMLCTLMVTGLKGAESGTRITAHKGRIVVEEAAPYYQTEQNFGFTPTEHHEYQYQQTAPSAPAASPLARRQSDPLSSFDTEALRAALIARDVEEGQRQFNADLLARRTERFRTQGSLPVVQATSRQSSTPTLPAVCRIKEQSAFDSTTTDDSESEDLSQTIRPLEKGHRRQRSASDTNLFTKSSEVATLERIAHEIHSPFNAIALAAITAFKAYEEHVLEELQKKSLELQNLFTSLAEKQNATVTPCEPIVRLLPKNQKATDNLHRGTIRIAREMESLSQQIAAATERLEKKIHKLASKKK